MNLTQLHCSCGNSTHNQKLNSLTVPIKRTKGKANFLVNSQGNNFSFYSYRVLVVVLFTL